MRGHVIPSPAPSTLNDHAESFDDQMIKRYPIIKSSDLLLNLATPDMEPPLKYYTRKAAEDNAQCFLKLKCIVQGTEAEVYVDKVNPHSEFRAAWRKLYNTFLGTRAKNKLAAQLEKMIQTLYYNGPKQRFTFATYVERPQDYIPVYVGLDKED